MERKAALAALLMAAGVAHAGCKELAAAVDDAEKEISSAQTDGVIDNSAPRETVRQLRVANAMSAIQANLTLMAAQKCPMPAGPITASGSAYFNAAIDCATSRLQSPGASDVPACDRKKWVRK